VTLQFGQHDDNADNSESIADWADLGGDPISRKAAECRAEMVALLAAVVSR
jgi:hypothetical protein